jgi:carbon starvation protein
MALGLCIAAVTGGAENQINAEPIRHVEGVPPMFPFLLVTIACGAVSGFHSLVSSGTTVRQLDKETDALPIGFGAMLMEGALAILVIMACVAGLGAAAWQTGGLYSSWGDVQGGGLGRQLAAVVNGGGQFLLQVGVPIRFGRAFLAVTIVAFALTTLDSATRLLRFNVEEIFRSVGLGVMANRYLASLIAVGGIAFFGLTEAGATLWILFGTMNQLLAGLTLLTVSLFLFKLGRNVWFTLVPMGIMLSVSIGAILYNVAGNWPGGGREVNWNQLGVSLIVLAMALWLIVEAVLSFGRGRGNLGLPEEVRDDTPTKVIEPSQAP